MPSRHAANVAHFDAKNWQGIDENMRAKLKSLGLNLPRPVFVRSDLAPTVLEMISRVLVPYQGTLPAPPSALRD